MSDSNVDTQELDENAVEEALVGTETEAGAETSEENPNSEESQVDEIDVSNLVGSQPDEEKKRNDAFARERVRNKELKAELEQLKTTGVAADTSDLTKPKRSDYLTEESLEKYDFNEQRALAAFEDARDDYNDQVTARQTSATTQTTQKSDQLRQEIEVEEKFEKHAKEVQKRVPDFNSKVAEAERILTPQGANMIKQRFGKDAPLMLAAMGAQPQYTRNIALMNDSFDVIQELTNLQNSVRNVVSSQKTVSTAQTETGVNDTNLSGSDSIQKAMDKAASEGNYKKFGELKAQLKRVHRANR